MMGAFTIGAVASGSPNQARRLTARTDISATGLRLQMERIPSAAMDELALNVLDIDGQSFLGEVVHPSSPQLAADPTPGRVKGNGKIVSALTGPLEVGALYVVSYDIIADGGTTGLYFSDGGGSPFPNSTVAAFTPGRHKILVEAKDTDTNAILRVNGDLTFGFISCRKAEWHMNLPSGSAYPEMAITREPGRIRGSGVAVSALNAPLEIGTTYTLRYEIKSNSGTKSLFTPAGAGSPFPFTKLPTAIGHHAVTLVAQDSDVDAVARLDGDLTFGSFSCRRAGGIAGRQIQIDVSSGSARSRNTIYTPDPGVLYVSPSGNDYLGSGAFGSPFATPAAACGAARPGDTVYLRPGTYAPFEILVSGTTGNPITVTTLPGEEHQAVIEGDLMQHVVNGGEGVASSAATRDGIYVKAKDHIHIRNLTIRNVWRCGIFFVGVPEEQHGHHVIAGNAISMTGSSGIYVGGNSSATIIPLGEKAELRTVDVLIEHNDVSQTNVVTDYNNNLVNPQGVPGGVAEAISVAASAGNIVTRFNDVHDTRQYGIDYKAGVQGGEIYGNRVWNVERYGIYLDAGRRFVEDVAIYNNQVWDCHLGIVLSREAGSNSTEYGTFTDQEGVAEFVQTLANIDIYNNLVWNIEAAGIFCQRHPQKDGPNGVISNIRIRFNTVYNANRMESGRDLNLSGWSDPDFEAAGVVSGVDFVGNIVWNDTASIRQTNTFVDKPGFTVADNLIGVDPSFVDVTATPPDLSLPSGTAAGLLVDAAATIGPFEADFNGHPRGVTRTAGAHTEP
ncbi:MAG: right-handed parallel beta-helix repeat-containing protein [Paracoccaceae bacterium]|nr:right-handed parallel beta-helix repeat-containing protein [Paracoccaceae bacterium]